MADMLTCADERQPAGHEMPNDDGDTRLSALDLTRGVAILGILPVHISIFGGSGVTPQQGTGSSQIDILGMFTMMLVEGKMVTVLAILFGVGLAIQSDHAASKGCRFAPYYARRMVFLFLIGLAHALLLFQWDILTSYAVAGMGALCLHRWSDRAIKRVAAGCFGWCYALLLICMLVAVMFHDQTAGMTDSQQPNETTEAAGSEEPSTGQASVELESDVASFFSEEHDVRVFRQGSFTDMVLHRAVYFAAVVAVFVLVEGWYTLACFLTGIVLCRRRVFHDVTANLSLWRKFIFVGLPIGILFHVVGIALYVRDPEGILPICVFALGILPLALGYLALLTLWSRSGRVKWLQRILESVGRLALSNYLFQSLVCGFVFYSYGLALYGQLTHAYLLLVVLCVWTAQSLMSWVYLRYFNIGPVEWLWRSLTEGRRYVPRPIVTNV